MLFCEKFKFSEKRISNESCILPNLKNVKFKLANGDVEVKPKLNAVQQSDKQRHPGKYLNINVENIKFNQSYSAM